MFEFHGGGAETFAKGLDLLESGRKFGYLRAVFVESMYGGFSPGDGNLPKQAFGPLYASGAFGPPRVGNEAIEQRSGRAI